MSNNGRPNIVDSVRAMNHADLDAGCDCSLVRDTPQTAAARAFLVGNGRPTHTSRGIMPNADPRRAAQVGDVHAVHVSAIEGAQTPQATAYLGCRSSERARDARRNKSGGFIRRYERPVHARTAAAPAAGAPRPL
jgi:hypothetical protein